MHATGWCQSFEHTALTGTTRRHVGVVLRKLFVRNPCAPPMLQRAAGDGLDAIVDADDWQAQLGLERICLAQVRWATSGFVQTYRIGTYGRIEGVMTVSDLMMAAEQDHESVKPLRKMYEFRGRSETLEDIATLVIGDAIPSPVALEDILVRFFRPRPNAMALMDHVGFLFCSSYPFMLAQMPKAAMRNGPHGPRRFPFLFLLPVYACTNAQNCDELHGPRRFPFLFFLPVYAYTNAQKCDELMVLWSIALNRLRAY
jgi:hypothetical protein